MGISKENLQSLKELMGIAAKKSEVAVTDIYDVHKTTSIGGREYKTLLEK